MSEPDKENASAASAEAEQQWPMKIPLRRAINRDGDPTKEIELREPTAGDIERVGNPVNIDFSQEPMKISFDERKMTAMLSTLASVPPSSIRAMNTKDWNTAAWGIAGFFIPDMGMG